MFTNLDAGELPSETEELWSLFDVVNCACGGHAGDDASMARVAAFCARSGVRLGAHPSYPDRAHFGRESLAIDPGVLAEDLAAQCRALAAHGVPIGSVKPHGALYHDAAASEAVAIAVIRGALEGIGPDVLVIGPPHGALHEAAQRYALTYAREGFADRRMRPDGSLVPRREPNALITDPIEAATQARRLASHVDTICVHGDTPDALAIARAVREALHG